MQRDFVALQWVTGEIEQACRQLGAELLGFADNLSEPTRLRHSLTLAHQVRATLRMLDIPSAEQLAQEVETVVQSMLHGELPAAENTLQALLAAGLQLPAYLRRIAHEQRELPADIIDTTNALRAARGEHALPLPEPELPGDFPELSDETGEAVADANTDDLQLLRKARQRFQTELLGLLKKESPPERMHALGRLFTSLAQRLRPGGQRLMWQACGAACDAVVQGGVEAGEPVISCLRQVDEEFRQLLALEQRFFSRRPSEQLYRNLLAIIADSLPATPGLIALQQRYRLLPSRAAAGQRVLEDLGATSMAVGALSSELSGMIGKLEGTEGDGPQMAQALREMEPELRRITSVLAGLGYRTEEAMLAPHIASISSGLAQGEGLDDRLMDIAAALVDVDQRLAERVVRAGGDTGDAAARRPPLKRGQEAVCREVQLGLESSKQAISDFFRSVGDIGLLAGLGERLNALAGALWMAELTGAAGILSSARDYVQSVVESTRPTPGAGEINAIADALSSVEYFLERLVVDGQQSSLILVRAQAALRQVVPDVPSVVPARASARSILPEQMTSEAVTELPSVPAESQMTEAVEASTEPAQEQEAEALQPEPLIEKESEHLPEPEPEPEPVIEGEELDPEILEIFVEEATEVLETITTQLPLWRAVTAPGPALTELRRAFHTLKGSGRMVGAAVIGELAWSIENLLNRIIDRTVEPGPAVIVIVERAQALLPSLIQAFAEHRPADAAGAAGVRETALALARGELPTTAAVEEPARGEQLTEPEAVVVERLAQPEPEPELATASDEDWLPEPAETVQPEISIEDWLPELEPAEEAESEVREIFTLEAREYLDALAACLGKEPTSADDALIRSVHTLRGGAHAAGLSALGELMDPLDAAVGAASAAERPLSGAERELLVHLCALLEGYISRGMLPDATLISLTEALRDKALAIGGYADIASVAPDTQAEARLIRFLEEALERLFHARTLLEAWRAGADPRASRESLVAELRNIHERAEQQSVNGVTALSGLLLAAAASLGEAQGEDTALLESGIEAFLDALDRLAASQRPQIDPLLLDALTAFVARPRETAPAVELPPAVMAEDAEPLRARIARELQQADPELLEIFLEEAEDLLVSIDQRIDDWQHDRDNRAPFERLQRDLHTLKGGARMAGLRHLGELSHNVETFLINQGVQFGSFDDAFFQRVLDYHEQLLQVMDLVREGPAVAAGVTEPPAPELDKQRTLEPEVLLPELLTEELVLEAEAPAPEAEPQAAEVEALAAEPEAPVTDIPFADEFSLEAEAPAPDVETTTLEAELQAPELDEQQTLEPEALAAEPETLVPEPLTEELVLEAEVPAFQAEVPASGEATAFEAELPVAEVETPSAEPEAPAEEMEARAASHEPETAPEPVLGDRERIARDLANADPDLLGIFLEEAEELMASVDSGIEAWRNARGNRALFDKLQRDLHTLKGGARMAGITVLGDLAHEFESMLIAEGTDLARLPDVFFRRVGDFHEQLARAMDIVRARPEPGSSAPEAAPVEHVSEAAEPAAEAAEPAPEEPVTPAPMPEPVPTAAQTLPASPPAPTVPHPAPQPVTAAAKPRDEVVRVSSQLLEDLVNLAGETSISRGRVEEHVSELSKLFDDMQSTIERLQSQVRRLDIATEAQILFRRERAETAGTEGFDPLEMDRYSQLQQLSRSLVESASDILDIKRTLSDKARDLETVLIQQSRINSQLQEGLMRSRMVPFASILPRIRRVVRQVATELGKNVELELGKMDGELDRGILERIVAPLEHMLRNAVDHGIESREERIAAGKPSTGRISIDISREGGDVLLALEDDGAGVNIAAVRRKAIERGLISADARLGDHEITQFILHSGFSTAEKITQISGRGVGMDVVSSEIRQMGGSLEIHSTPGKGSRFVIRLPFTVSVSRSLMVVVGSDTYALPLNTVEGVVRMSAQEMTRHTGTEAEPLTYAGQQYAMRHLGGLLYPGEEIDRGNPVDNVPVVLVRGGGQALAVPVDRLIGAREVVVKGLGPQFGAVPGLSGATVLGDGSVVLILDIPAMLRADSTRGTQRGEELARTEAAPQAERPPLVMVVDDSVTVRKVTTRFLEREGMRVVSAKDGAEAMVMLAEQVPDLMLLDIEMPHMDGFEVLAKLRLNDALRGIPVIMITSRTGDKHRERALGLGANMYLGKPYQESVLLEHINTLLAGKRQGSGR